MIPANNGTPHANIEVFLPKVSVRYPPINEPIRALRGTKELIQDFCSSVTLIEECSASIDFSAGEVYALL